MGDKHMKKTTKRVSKVLAVLLSILFVVEIIPMQVFATAAEKIDSPVENSTTEESKQAKEKQTEEAFVLSEDTSKREENVKHFQMSDGTMRAVQYAVPVHFEKNGVWTDFDNTLNEVNAEESDEQTTTYLRGKLPKKKDLINKTANYTVRFAKHTNDNKFVCIKKDGYKITWAYKNANKSTAKVVKPTVDDNPTTLENLNSTVQYKKVFKGVDFEYIVNSTGVKENILLRNAKAPSTFVAEYKAEGLIPVQIDNKTIELQAKDGSCIYTISAPYMEDTLGERSNQIVLTLKNVKDNTFTVKMDLDVSWIKDPKRSFPVIVDPFMETSQSWDDKTNCQSAYISSSHPDSCYGRGGAEYEGSLYVGKTNGRGKTRSFIKVPNLPHLDVADTVVYAEMSTFVTACYPSLVVELHNVLSPWSESTVSWNSRPQIEDEISDYQYIKTMERYDTDADRWQRFEITSLVQQWYSGALPNNGVCLISDKENNNSQARAWLLSSGYTTVSGVRPVLSIHYRNMSGYENYYSYTSLPAARYGQISVNNYNGNLVFTEDVTQDAGGNLMPVNFAITYNSNGVNAPYSYLGGSMQTNFHLYLTEESGKLKEKGFKYFLNDGDGTRHWFFFKSDSPNCGHDEDGLGLTLDIVNGSDSKCSSAKYRITNKQKEKMYFDNLGHIIQITNPQDVSITLQYETVGSVVRIASITDGAGRVYTCGYNPNHPDLLMTITDPSKRVTAFDYWHGTLYSITYPDGKVFTLYYTDNFLTQINGNGMHTYISYDNTPQHRVSSISYGISESNLLEKYTFEYKHNETKITDLQNRSYKYQFNDLGQNTGVVSMDEGIAQYFQYHEKDGSDQTDAKTNKLISESKVLQTVNNYVLNSGFCRDFENFRYYVEDTSNQSISVDASTRNSTKASAKITKGSANHGRVDLLQSINNLPAGTYTYSAYANTKGVELNGQARVFAEVWSNDGYLVSSNQAEYISKTSDWERRSITFSVPENCEVRLLMGFLGDGSGTVWFDDIQLEKGPNPSSYNLVENPCMEYGGKLWSETAAVESTGNELPGIPKCITQQGDYTSRWLGLIQHIEVTPGKKGDSFSFGAWIKAASVPVYNGTKVGDPYIPEFKLSLHFYNDNGWVGVADVSPNPDLNTWQYLCGKAIAPADYTRVALELTYYNNENPFSITGAFCYKERYGQTYTYDKDGNVVSSVDLANTNSSFSYANNQMKKMTNPSGSRFLYNYDEGSENLHYALTSDGREYSFAYDNKGNTTIADLQARQVSATIENNQEYFLMNAYSGLAMDSYWKGNTGDLTTTYRYMPYNLNQHWKFEAVNGSSDVFYLKSVEFKDRYLNVCSGLGIDDVNLEIFPFDGKAKEQFKFVKQEDGSYGIFTGASGFERCIDGQKVAGKEVLQSTHIRQVDCDKNNLKEGQKWYLIPVVPTENQLIRTEASYTPSGNFVKTQSDQRGNVTSYAFDENKGTLTSTTDALGNQTAYTYDSKTDAMTSVTAGGMTNSYAYENDRLKNINVNGALQYQFEYDDFGRTSATKVGNGTNWRNLSSLSYNNNGLMTNQTYGNGDAIAFSYDNLDRMTEKKYNDDANQRITYSYGNDGNLAQTVDFTTGTRTKFTYDLVGRVAEQKEYASTGLNGGTLLNSTKFIYADKTNYLTGVEHKSPLGTQNIGYRYGNAMQAEMPDQVYDVTWNGAKKVSYSYDGFGRLKNKQIGGKLNNKLTYIDRNENYTTTLLQSVETAAGTFTYTYDSLGNIVSISDGTYTTTYVYDNLNQLVRSNDEKAGKTFTYAYTNGNITEKKEYAYTTGDLGAVVDTTTWSYGDSTWSDLLTNFNGEAITYDTIGNPLTIGNKSLTWQGRQLQSITDGANTYSYKYNMDGQRLSKTVNGVTTEYFYNGSILAGQKTGDNILVLMYDNNGDVFGFTYNGTEYFYVKNAQNDVVAITDANGTIIARYTYDDWGKLISTTDANGVEITDENHIANINPLRYRSYYLDAETGFYHLKTRYYAPSMCRFLNADAFTQTGQGMLDKNIFAYCLNNPINGTDETGTITIGALLTIVVVSVITAAITSALSYAFFKEKPTAKGVLVDASINVVDRKVPITGKISKGYNSGKRMKSAQRKRMQHAKNCVNANYAIKQNKPTVIASVDYNVFPTDEMYSQYCQNQVTALRQHTELVDGFSIEGKCWDDLTEDQREQIVNQMGSWDMEAAKDIGGMSGIHAVFSLFV